MSFCRSKSNEKNPSLGLKNKTRKSKDINRLLVPNYPMDIKHHSACDFHKKLKMNYDQIRKAGTNEIELPLKEILENHEKSTFFLDFNEHNQKETLRECDIVINLINQNATKESEFSPNKSSAQKNWGVILNVFKAISNMKNVGTKSVISLTELDRSFKGFEKIHLNRKKNNVECIAKMNREKEGGDVFNDNFEQITKQIKLFEFVASGVEENIDKIIQIVKDDRKRNVYDVVDKKHFFINQKNHEGVTPLYVACLNGHIKIAEVLLKYNADPCIKCGVLDDEESVLELAIRWGHIKLVEYLIKLEWPNEYLKAALKLSIEQKNDHLTKLIKKAMAEWKIKNKQKYRCCFG